MPNTANEGQVTVTTGWGYYTVHLNGCFVAQFDYFVRKARAKQQAFELAFRIQKALEESP